MGASLTPSHAHLSSGCGIMVGLGKPKLYTKFELHSFSHCVNIEEKPQILSSLSSACDFMMGLGKPQLRAKFEVAIPSRLKNIIGKP